MKTGGVNIEHRHVDVGGQDGKEEQYQADAGRLSGFRPKKPEAAQNLENAAEIDEFPRQGQVIGHDADIGIGLNKMSDALNDHDQRQRASVKSQ